MVAGEDDGLALFAGKVLEGAPYGFTALPIDEAFVHRNSGLGYFGHGIQRHARPAHGAALAVPAGIRGDREEPGSHGRAPVVLIGSRHELQKDVLSDFLGLGGISEQSAREPQERRRIAVEELGRSLGFSAANLLQRLEIRFVVGVRRGSFQAFLQG